MTTSNNPTDLPVARRVLELRNIVAEWKKAGLTVSFVPTMGALHEGHMSLVKLAKEKADRVVVSIFVNPTQFGPGEDFESYPRTEETDLAQLKLLNVDLVYIPNTQEMYPEGHTTTISVKGLTDCLCGLSRPGHFDGVTTIVAKLFNQVAADFAVFGSKDYQQLMIVQHMVRDLDIPTEIVSGITLREEDGLAISSRNAYLSPEERKIAAKLNEILASVVQKARQGLSIEKCEQEGKEALHSAGFDSVDYLEIRRSNDLKKATSLDKPARVFGAVRLGKTRLIDNMAIS